MAEVVTCAAGIVDCAINNSDDICANYNGLYSNLQSSEWMLVLSFIIMATMAFYIGANDVANAFGTSVGSKAISTKWACILGGIANWLGAVTLGYGVSSTIQSGVAKVTVAECWACGFCDSQISVYALGMFAALIGASSFLAVATFTAMPVSTTHAIIGGIVGVTIFGVGGGCLNWKFDGGLSGIIASWVISPVLSGVIGMIVYLTTHYAIMASKNKRRNALWSLPALYALCTFIMLFMIFLKSTATKKKLSKGVMVLISAIAAVVVGALVQIFLVPYVRKRLPSQTHSALIETDHHALVETPGINGDKDDKNDKDFPHERMSIVSTMSENEIAVRAELDNLTEEEKDAMFVFKYLLVLVATLESYAHGANDTANATGPVAAIYNVYDNGLDSCGNKETPVWIMAIAGAFVCIGIILHGNRVMETIGKRISVMDMQRGFAMEFSSTITVVIATLLKLPVSTTHCQVGSVFFVSLINPGWRNVSFPMLGKIVLSWVVTLPFSGFVAVFLTMIFRSSIRL